MMHFGVHVVKDDDDMDLADREDRSLPDKSGLESIRDSALGTIGLSSDKLELVSSVVTETVRQMGKLGASHYELAALFAILLRDKSSSKAMALLPECVQSVLGSREKLCALLRMLAIDKKLFVVGSGDIRYVASDEYKYWSVELDEPGNMIFVPHIGQSFNGSTITKYTLGMMTSITGHIFDNPGISQATLMRRHYAPFVPKAEVVHYLDKLIELGIVNAETVDIGNAAPSADTANRLHPGDPSAITFYSMADGYSSRISELSSCFAVTNLERF
ncbi:hypothetical protein GGI22_004519 [Coemansia erecta]|nr:hypothetical protein GGI22_004519 [Coemansia erecta]